MDSLAWLWDTVPLQGQRSMNIDCRGEQLNRMDLAGLPRREFFGVLAAGIAVSSASESLFAQSGRDMYGLITKITATTGKRDELITVLLDGAAGMPGCLSYIIAKDTTDGDAIWISEAWDSKASHDGSLLLQSVKDAMTKGRPLIAGFGNRVVTTPVGGTGLGVQK